MTTHDIASKAMNAISFCTPFIPLGCNRSFSFVRIFSEVKLDLQQTVHMG